MGNDTKPVLGSKINWVSIVMVVWALAAQLQGLDWAALVGETNANIILGALGVLLFIFRTFFTRTAVDVKHLFKT